MNVKTGFVHYRKRIDFCRFSKWRSNCFEHCFL